MNRPPTAWNLFCLPLIASLCRPKHVNPPSQAGDNLSGPQINQFVVSMSGYHKNIFIIPTVGSKVRNLMRRTLIQTDGIRVLARTKAKRNGSGYKFVVLGAHIYGLFVTYGNYARYSCSYGITTSSSRSTTTAARITTRTCYSAPQVGIKLALSSEPSAQRAQNKLGFYSTGKHRLGRIKFLRAHASRQQLRLLFAFS